MFIFKKYIVTSIFLLLISIPYQLVFATSFSIDAVYFNEKKPSTKDDINSSLIEYSESLKVLRNDVSAIKSLKAPYIIKVIGSTDNKECSDSECKYLSLRRAQLIYNWMLANGVPPSRLLAPEGHGSDDAFANNEIPRERPRNRRVEFQIVPDTPPQ